MKKIFSIFAAALFCANISAQQLSESFENETFPPEGWTAIADHSYPSFSSWNRYVKQEGSTITIADGVACAYVNPTPGASNYLITPQLRPVAGEKLIFYARVDEYAKGGELQVLVSVNGNSVAEFADTLGVLPTSSTAADPRLFKEWQAYQLPMDDYAGQRIFVAFHHYDKSSACKIYLDNVYGVTLAGSSTCESPYSVEVTKVKSTEVTISWQGEAAQYEYVLMAAGQAPSWAGAAKTAEKSVTLTDLYEDTSYVFYVRSYCSEAEQSLAPHVSFKTPCEQQSVPWIETFTRDATGDVSPYCWIVSSATPRVWVVADKVYDEVEEEYQIVYGQAHLGVSGGGPNTAQIFALPAFDAKLDTLEVAFDYHTQMADDERYGKLEIGYMTNPSNAATFVSLKVLPQTLEDEHVIFPLTSVPADAQYIAFRFAGGTTSDLGSLAMDNFVVAAIGHSQEIDPADEDLPDAAIWSLTYCEAGFTWYSYVDDAFAIALFDVESQQMIAGITPTTSECERFANADEVEFSEYDDYQNHYYCSTKWILNVDESGLMKGDAWSKCVINIGTTVSSQLGLKPGKYQVQVYALEVNGASYAKGALLATIPFELVSVEVSNLQVAVAEDKTTATLTWETPALSTGERIYASIRSGATVVYDNYDDTHKKAVSPLTVNVEDGKTYDVRFQIIDKDNNPLGVEVTLDFTVGVNKYEPQDLQVSVANGDAATFSWTAAAQADAYMIALYREGEFYSSISVIGAMTRTSYMPEDGTWTWTVQAQERGVNGNYFPISKAVEGESFIVAVPDIPSGSIEVTPWEMEAAYYPVESDDPDYREGKYIWFVRLLCGNNGSAYPAASFIIYSDKEDAISGSYATKYNNIYMGDELTMMEIVSGSANVQRLTAADAELKLGFEDFDQEYFDQGYRFGRYSGQFTMRLENGTVYAGRFNDIFCDSYNAAYLLDPDNNSKYHVGMWGEEGYTPQPPEESIENVVANTKDGQKFIYNGQLFILREGKIYNVLGTRIK